MSDLKIVSIDLRANVSANGKTFLCKTTVVLSDGVLIPSLFPVLNKKGVLDFLKKLEKAQIVLNEKLYNLHIGDYEGLQRKVKKALKGELSSLLFPITFTIFKATSYAFSLPISKMIGGVFEYFYPEPFFYYGKLDGGKVFYNLYALLDVSTLKESFFDVLNHESKNFSPHHEIKTEKFVKNNEFAIDVRGKVEPDFISLVAEKFDSVTFFQEIDDVEALFELAPPLLSRIVENSVVVFSPSNVSDDVFKFFEKVNLKGILLVFDETSTLSDTLFFAKRLKKLGFTLFIDVLSDKFESIDLLEFSIGIDADKILIKNSFKNVINLFNFFIEKYLK